MPGPADRDLLYGLIALNNHVVDQADLLAAFHSWSETKGRTLAQVLLDRKAINPDDDALIENLVRRHLARFGDDAAQSLAALKAVDAPVLAALNRLPDPDLHASIGRVAGPPEDDGATVMRSPHWTPPEGPESRFRVLRFHAKGGLGQVSVALDKELGREVAFKEIQERYADEDGSRVRFNLEAEITGGLEHPGIVPVYSLGRDVTGRPYYAMRFIRGDNLHEAAKRFHSSAGPTDPADRSLALRELLGRFGDVCNAVAYAHSRGVLHRDIKPGNIMLGAFGETLVVDWGLAKLVADDELLTSAPEGRLRPASAGASGSGSGETVAGTAVGTPAYMSPEQAAGRLDLLGPASDVYSLGATLYSLLTGRAPFKGDAAEIVAAVPRGEFPRPRALDPRISRGLEAICLKAMATEPSARYDSPLSLAADLKHWLADEPVSALPEGLAPRVARWTRRHKSATLSAAAALAAVAFISTFASLAVSRALTAAQAALTSEKTALELQRQATETSERDRKRSEQRETMAVDAIKKFEKAVVDNPRLKNDVKLRPLRNALLKEPLQFSRSLRSLLQKDGDTRPESLARLAAVCFSLAVTTGEIGDTLDAIKAYDESILIYERLAAEHPTVPGYSSDLAECLNNLGGQHAAAGSADLATEEIGRALLIFKRLVEQNPSVVAYQANLASGYGNLGILHYSAGRLDLALEDLGRALSLQERLVKEHPAVAAYQVALARSHNTLGALHGGAGRNDLAVEDLTRALSIKERLVKEHPSVAAYRNDLAGTHINLGGTHRERRPDVAALEFGRALDIYKRLVAENPAVVEYQNNLASCHSSLGSLHNAAGRVDLAAEEYGRALVGYERLVKENPAVVEYKHQLAWTYSSIGRFEIARGRTDRGLDAHKRAVALLEQLVKDNPTVLLYQTDLAKVRNNLAEGQFLGGRADLAVKSLGGSLLKFGMQRAKDIPPEEETQKRLGTSHYNQGKIHRINNRVDLALDSFQLALNVQEGLVRKYESKSEYKTDLAATHYAIALALAHQGAANADAKQSAALADRAIASLRKAAAAGWTDWKQAAEDADLKILRDRADFKALIQAKTKAAPPSAGAK